VKLYWHPFSIMPWRIRIALREKRLAAEEVLVDVTTSGTRKPEFLRLNPFGQIPVLEDGALTISESIAILEYLEERYPEPALLPHELPLRARARELMCWSTDYWPPAWKQWMAPRLPGAPWTEDSIAEGRRELAAHLDVLAPNLAHHDWLVGSYSLADICYAPLVLVLDRVDLGEEVAKRPAIARWVQRLRDRPAVRDSMMPPAPRTARQR
jgi:glutathione S-transferase